MLLRFLPQLLGLDATRTNEILDTGAASQRLVSQELNELWTKLFASNFYTVLVHIGIFFALLLLLYNVVDFLSLQETSDGSWTLFVRRLLWLFIVFALLSRDGALLRTCTITMRDTWNGINQTIMTEAVIDDATFWDIFEKNRAALVLNSERSRGLAQCDAYTNPEAKQKCREAVEENVRNIAKQQGYDSGILGNVLNSVGTALAEGIEFVLVNFMLAMAIAVQWLVEISWILTGLIGPIFVGLSPLPVAQKGLLTWLIAFSSIGFYKLCFNILMALVAFLSGQSPSTNGLIFAVAVGLLCPVLAFIIAAGGGTSVFTSLAAAGLPVAAASAGGVTKYGGMAANYAGRKGVKYVAPKATRALTATGNLIKKIF
jgi:hypothetical protein